MDATVLLTQADLGMKASISCLQLKVLLKVSTKFFFRVVQMEYFGFLGGIFFGGGGRRWEEKEGRRFTLFS